MKNKICQPFILISFLMGCTSETTPVPVPVPTPVPGPAPVALEVPAAVVVPPTVVVPAVAPSPVIAHVIAPLSVAPAGVVPVSEARPLLSTIPASVVTPMLSPSPPSVVQDDPLALALGKIEEITQKVAVIETLQGESNELNLFKNLMSGEEVLLSNSSVSQLQGVSDFLGGANGSQAADIPQAYELLQNLIIDLKASERASILKPFRDELVTRILPHLKSVLIQLYEKLQAGEENTLSIPGGEANTLELLKQESLATGARASREEVVDIYDFQKLTLPPGDWFNLAKWEVRSKVAINNFLNHLIEGKVLKLELEQLLEDLSSRGEIPMDWYTQAFPEGGATDLISPTVYPDPDNRRIFQILMNHPELQFAQIAAASQQEINGFREELVRLTARPIEEVQPLTREQLQDQLNIARQEHAEAERVREEQVRVANERLQTLRRRVAAALGVSDLPVTVGTEIEMVPLLRNKIVSIDRRQESDSRLQSMDIEALLRKLAALTRLSPGTPPQP